EFLEMIHVIYASHKKNTDDSVDFILKLGDRFQIKTLLDLAEDYLISSSALESSQKLLLSDKYRLIKLQDHCLNQLETVSKVKGIKRALEYDDLSETTKVALLEKMFKLTPD
ncbi:hypothetical protein PMAYCL1PPCAC_24942, partial [Pristionchus mayeri]